MLMFMPAEETLRSRITTWNTMQMEPLMARLQKELPVIEYKGTDWVTDIRIAKAIVAQQPKRILFLYFTDNSEFCQKFEKEILETEDFTGWPYHHCVLVRLDYTPGIEQPRYISDQNKAMADLYGIRGYPFVVMVNPKGQKIGEAKYMKGGPKTFLEEMKKMYNADYDRRTLISGEPGK
jgi:thioredoxin-related protein